MKTFKQSQSTARKALHLYELGQKEDAKRLAKRVSWRTLFLIVNETCDHTQVAALKTDKLKGIEG